MSEWPSKWNIAENTYDDHLTFVELHKRHVTSEQLYLWSASMDIAELYQLYLDQVSTTNDVSLGTQIFYNCTPPRFGSICQYSFDYQQLHHSSLNELIHDFYVHNQYRPTTLTCYTHLKCNRGSISACLDWTEICDGIIDCMDGIDEQHCWPFEMNKCKTNEFQCHNGQCIPRSFFYDNRDFPDCLDGSDEAYDGSSSSVFRKKVFEPIFLYEDILCRKRNALHLSPYTRSCSQPRSNLLSTAMYSDKPQSISDLCWSAFKCVVNIIDSNTIGCPTFCSNGECEQIIQDNCPDMLYIPAGPVLFGHIYFLYTKEDASYTRDQAQTPQYICYNDQLCSGFRSNSTVVSFNNATCHRPEDFSVEFDYPGMWSMSAEVYVGRAFPDLYKCNTIRTRDSSICDRSIMYQCINSSKCITKDRLCDKIKDCDYEDDEQCQSHNGMCPMQMSSDLFHCSLDHQCISNVLVGNGECDCDADEYYICEDENTAADYIRKHISFSTICDGFTDLIPTMIDGQNQTDETECQYWSCNNTYTRCNEFWNCFNGADEVDCNPSPSLECPLHHHICVSPDTNQLMCLPIVKANDNNIDCLGGTDEPRLCRSNSTLETPSNFYCKTNISGDCVSSFYMCNSQRKQCMYGEDFQFCTINLDSLFTSMCDHWYETELTDVETFFCTRPEDTHRIVPVHFSMDSKKSLFQSETKRTNDIILSDAFSTDVLEQRCHRGLDLRVWLSVEENITTTTCLCPPSFYGDICQYQNQRVSFTVQFSVLPDSQRTAFTIIVALIDDDDDQRTIHSAEQFTYLSIRDCDTKFNIYLLYSNRPKNQTKHYSIHIDIYEKLSLMHRGSLFVPLDFPFLPVHRIAAHLHLPGTRDIIETCVDHRCRHGQCLKYFNNPTNDWFCRCNQGWSGRYCTIPHKCSCSSGSLCLGVLANNRSICVCPIDKFGSRCLLPSTRCQSNQNMTCSNHGQCIPLNEDIASEKEFTCICSKGFTGDTCEFVDAMLIISFQNSIVLPQSMIIHFIRAMDNLPAENGTTFKTIPIIPDRIIVHWSRPFHVAFIELSKQNYYLVIVQNIYNKSTTIMKTIDSSDRCKHINEIFNETIIKLHPLRRIKYYQLPCRNQSSSPLSCFYDGTLFCFCYQFGHQRLANCFEYNLTKKLDCFGQNYCENSGKCLQDSVKCPQTSICLCPACFYGTRCQFRSSGFGHSLDALLGYHILPHINIWRQPTVVKISAILTILMCTVGFLNSIIGILTFREKDLRTNGCAFYLFSSSIVSLLIMIIFFLKFWILIIAQMTPITNRIFLQFQCLSIDVILRITLNIDQWLNACVAIEQAMTTLQGNQFNKDKSKYLAKYIIPSVVLLTIGTAIHEPFHQRLIDDDEERRIWCIVTYSDRVQLYDSIVNIIHFFVPFMINLISAIVIIIKLIRQPTVRPRSQSIRRRIYEQKHVLLSPILLVFLAAPSIIIYLVTNCVESASESKIFLAGYFMSFSPSILTFFLFILPSKLYKRQFSRLLKQYQLKTRIQLLRLMSRLSSSWLTGSLPPGSKK